MGYIRRSPHEHLEGYLHIVYETCLYRGLREFRTGLRHGSTTADGTVGFIAAWSVLIRSFGEILSLRPMHPARGLTLVRAGQWI